MNTGYKIRKFRMYRGFTQKALGQTLGISERSADIRIAQYESGTRNPKPSTLEEIASSLLVTPETLCSYPTDSALNIIAFLADAISQGYLVPERIVNSDGTEQNVLYSNSTDISAAIGFAAKVSSEYGGKPYVFLTDKLALKAMESR